MFTALIVKPLFNLLVLVLAIIPGHNFGLALIVFTILFRLALWPLVKKQLHQAKKMRKLQPELKKIKKLANGNRQKESQLTMELYKEKGINPLGTLPILIFQLFILIGLNSGIAQIIKDPKNIVDLAYTPLQHLGFMHHLATNINSFDNTLFEVVNLGKSALSHGVIYWPSLIIVILSAAAQYFQGKQLLPNSKDQKSLREIMKSASKGDSADQSEINNAVGRSTQYLLPVMILLFTISLPSALSLYWLTSGIVAYMQQASVLKEDEEELEELADEKKNTKEIPEAEIVVKKSNSKKTSNKKSNKGRKK